MIASPLFQNLGLLSGPSGLGTEPQNMGLPTDPVTEDPKPPVSRIPLPNYKDPASRAQYALAFRKKYGDILQGRGDTPLRFNEKPYGSNMTSKQLVDKISKQYNVDPALLYSGAMEEGMSGIYPGQQYLEYKLGPNKDFPIDALWSFGLDSFMNKQQDLVKQGLLPKDFNKRWTTVTDPMKGVDRAYFKSPEEGLMATAAMWKTHYNDIDNYAKKMGIQLSPKARDFFSRIGFNAGEGTARQMISDYNNNGLLENDEFLKKRPTSGKGLKQDSYKDTYENVQRIITMANALRNEGYFDEELPPQMAAPIAAKKNN